jgi:hypothetical protein
MYRYQVFFSGTSKVRAGAQRVPLTPAAQALRDSIVLPALALMSELFVTSPQASLNCFMLGGLGLWLALFFLRYYVSYAACAAVSAAVLKGGHAGRDPCTWWTL